MVSLLQSLSRTVHLSLLITVILLIGLHFSGDGFVLINIFLVGYLDTFTLLLV